MFDQLRDSLRALSDRLEPDERRRVTGAMRDAMVHAKLAMQDLRDALLKTEQRLAVERSELETVKRRQGLAAQIGDAETVAIAERFAVQHAERIGVLESKRLVQQQELTLNDRELDAMSSQLRMAMSGLAPGGITADVAAQREVDAFLTDDPQAAQSQSTESEVAPVRRTRAERESDAEDRLAALKRRMGK